MVYFLIFLGWLAWYATSQYFPVYASARVAALRKYPMMARAFATMAFAVSFVLLLGNYDAATALSIWLVAAMLVPSLLLATAKLHRQALWANGLLALLVLLYDVLAY